MTDNHQLVWLKRDLRVRDHRPLTRAARNGPCIICYVYEPERLNQTEVHPAHVRFINESLQELDKKLRERGGAVTYRVGRLPDVFQKLHRDWPIDQLWTHEETGMGITYKRDKRVRGWANEQSIPIEEIPQTGVVRGLEDRDGWAEHWNERMSEPLTEPPERIKTPDELDHGSPRTPDELEMASQRKPERQSGGESHARSLLASFLTERGEPYATSMSSPVTAWDHCSRLSAHLAWGTISMRQVFQSTLKRRRQLRDRRDRGGDTGTWLSAIQSFLKRLHWRAHFMQKLEDEPRIEFENLATAYDGLREDDFDEDTFEAWKRGETGFPMVDACMRCLHESGWINFRMRAMITSFSSYHLWNHWRKPARWLARHFLDFEPGIHFPQIQMQSGTTGINSIRIYNPTKQVHDHDPDGEFIREYVPELAEIPKQYLAEPWTTPGYLQEKSDCVIGEDYPEPIVDGGEAYHRARDRIYQVKNSPEAKKEAERIVEKHGSRRNRS